MSRSVSVLAFFDVAGGHHSTIRLYTWLTSGILDVHIGLSIDRLTAVMLLLVTTVSALVHIYTIGYMHGDPGYARFFSYIALFTFSMLMLVTGRQFSAAVRLLGSGRPVFVSLDRPLVRTAIRPFAAATKAFIVNRVGDFGFFSACCSC